MIGAMRKNRKILAIILWLVIIAFVSTIFVVWGIGTKENLSMYVAKVGDETITYEEYRNAFERQISLLRQIMGDEEAARQNDSAQFAAVVLDDIINTKLMLKEADRLKIPASDYEIVQMIQNTPAFQVNGQFSPEAYKDVLSANRLTPAFFEQNQRDAIKIEKLRNLIVKSASVVSEDAIKNEYVFRNTKAEAEYFPVPVKDFLGDVVVTPDNLSAYYETHKEEYRLPAKIALKYVVFDKSKFGDNLTVTDEEISQYYNNNLASFSQPETIDIRSIVVPVKSRTDEKEVAAAKAKIDEALAELKKGAKFVDMVEKYSDSVMKTNGGLISDIRPEQMQKEMADTVKTLNEGQYSEVINTDGGFLIIYLEKRRPAKVSALAEVKNEIITKLKDNKLAADFRKYVYDLYKDILKSGNLTAYMKAKPENGLKAVETPVFTEKEDVLEVFRNQPDVKAKIFALNKTDMSQVVTDGNMTYFFEVVDKVDSVIPPLDAVMNNVNRAYMSMEAAKIGEMKVAEAIKAGGFEKAAKDFNARITTTKPFLRNDKAADFGNDQDLVSAVFKAKAGQSLDKAYLVGDNVYGVKVKSVVAPSLDNLQSEKNAIESYIRSVKEDAALKSYLDDLRSKTKIEISESFKQSVIDTKKK